MTAAQTSTYESPTIDGVAGAGLLIRRAGTTGDAPLMPGLTVTVGREASCGIRIDDPAVSRTHTELCWDGAASLRVRDLGSRNGTWISGERADGIALVGSGTEIRIGPTRLLFYVRTARRSTYDPEILTQDAAMQRALDLADRAAAMDTCVLVIGETGTGKELVARRIHARSPRAGGPFLSVNCGAIPETLATAELLGHERGAFTGAATARAGLFERAAGGTIFLDEIGELGSRAQALPLRVLQERSVVRIGSARPIALDLRVIAATHRDLDAMVRDGSFRHDLLFRLDVLRIVLPPLRVRPGDVPLLARRFVAELAPSGHPGLTKSALAALASHSWPGNARELRNVIERALAEGGIDRISDVIARVIAHGPAPTSPDLARHLAAVEREQLVRALESCEGNRSRAARLLGITRSALLHRLGKHDIGRAR